MDDVRRFCVRMLGDGPAAREAEQAARAAGDGDPMAMLGAAVSACRERADADGAVAESATAQGAIADADRTASGPASDPRRLASAVARELRAASGRLAPRQREALALRELLGKDYDEMARLTGADTDAVASALADARISLREELRGPGAPQPPCDERERALRTIARRQDGQPVADADADWLVEHLGHCRGCGQAHAAMLEATACYGAWSADDEPSQAAAGASSNA
jgi:sigma-70-like protein